VDVQTAVDRFIVWCSDKRARATCLLYHSRLRSLVAFVPAEGEAPLGVRELGVISREMIEAWLAAAARHPDGRPKAPDTIRANAIAFVQLQKWAVDYGFLANLIVEKVKKPMGRWRERIPSPEETARLLEHAPREFELMYRALRQSGARPNELCRATIADWKRGERMIVLARHKTAEKTGRTRKIAVGAKLEAMLFEAIGTRSAGPIFLNQKGSAWQPQRLSTIYRNLRNRAGLPKDLCLYLTRHEHGTILCRERGIKVACDALGHTTINTTQRYAHTTIEEQAAAQDVF